MTIKTVTYSLFALLVVLTFALMPRHHFSMTTCAVNACLPTNSYIASLDTYVGPWPVDTNCALQENYHNTPGTVTDRTHCRVSTRHLLSPDWHYSYIEHIAPNLPLLVYLRSLGKIS